MKRACRVEGVLNYISIRGVRDLEVPVERSLERRAERNQRAETEDFDGEEMEALNDEQAAEDDVFDQFAECVGSLLRALHSPVLQTLEPLLVQYVAPMLAPGRSPEERRIAICVFDDVMAGDTGDARTTSAPPHPTPRLLKGCFLPAHSTGASL